MLTIENVSNTLNGILDTNDHTLHVFITDDDGSWGMAPKVSARTPLKSVEMRFHDIESDTEPGTLFTEVMANTFVAWLNRQLEENDIDTIIVSCDGGISRSAAFNAALNLHFNGTTAVFENARMCPNRHVFNMLMKALGEDIDSPENKEKFDALFAHNLEIWSNANL